MGKPTGFLEWDREGAHKRPVGDRVRDFREFSLPVAADQSQRQGGRCMDCGVPFCHQGCPLGNLIPDFNEQVFRGDWRRAYELLASTNDFPEFTGRICPAPCEASCVLAIDQPAVTIEQLEKDIIDRAFLEGWVVPRPPAQRTGKHVAVVGSGPAGLAAASQLNRRGHLVTVYERADRIGGLLRYGIPDFKLEKHVVDRRVALLEAEGVRFQTGVDVGAHPKWDELHRTHDAVVVAIGAMEPRRLEVPGVELPGVHLAMEYLEAQNRAVATGTQSAIQATGQRVVVLGGGDTGSDCVGTAHRQKAASVSQVELMPAPPAQRSANNPWPEWPRVMRLSSSQEEGGERLFGKRTLRLEGDGRLEAMVWQNEDGSEERVPVDLLLLALGFVHPVTGPLVEQLGLTLNARGAVQVDANGQTSLSGVFAAGDASRGASLVVWAIAEGRKAAQACDRWLTSTSQSS